MAPRGRAEDDGLEPRWLTRPLDYLIGSVQYPLATSSKAQPIVAQYHFLLGWVQVHESRQAQETRERPVVPGFRPLTSSIFFLAQRGAPRFAVSETRVLAPSTMFVRHRLSIRTRPIF